MIHQTVERGAAEGAGSAAERFAYAALDALSEHVAVLDTRGNILAVNRAWREFAAANSPSPAGLSEGANYFVACAGATGAGAVDAARFAAGLRAVIGGESEDFTLEYPCHSPTQQRWFIARAKRFEFEGEVRAVVTHANITARRLAEEAIRFQSHLLDTVEQAVVATDLGGKVIYWNRFAEQLYGWPAAEAVGRYIAEVVLPPAARERAAEVMSRLQAGQSWSGEFTVQRRDGTTFQAFITDAPIYDERGTVVGVVGVSRDITERRRAEEERERLLRSLESERARLAYLFTHAPSFVAVLRGPDHTFELTNPSYLELVGGRAVLGKPVREVLPEIEGQGYLERLDEVYRTGEPHAGRGVPVLLKAEPGGPEEEHFLDFVYQPMFDADGAVSGIFVHGVDVTEHKRAEGRARASEERYRTLFSSIDEGFGVAEVLFDEAGRGLDHRFLEVNPSFEKQTGIPVEVILSGRTVSELVPEIERHWSEIYGRVALTGEPERFVGGSDALGRWFDVYVFRVGRAEERKVAILFNNITERRLAEQRLRESEEHLRALFEASRDGILVEHGERAVYVNDAYARLFGYEKPEELIGEHVSAVVAPDDAERLLEYGRRRMRGEPAPVAFEFKGRRKDGTLLDIDASVSTHAAAGQTYITTAVRDISERKRAEEALRQSESKYRLLLEQASDGIHTYDARGNFIETNSKLCEMLGYTREELLRLNVANLIPPEDMADAPIRFDKLRAGETVLAERRLLRKDGTLLPVEISGRMIRDGVFQSIIRDISERKRAEAALREAYDEMERRVEERTAELARANETLKAENAERLRAEETLRESEQRLKIALQTGNLGSWQFDLKTLELECSPTCKANFGLPPEARFTYQDLFEAIDPEDRARVRAAVRRAVDGRGDYHAEYRAAWPDGSTHWIVAHGRGIYDAAGTPLRMVGVTADITERREAEESRRELLRRLVAAQEEERRRISRELHDQMGQQLAALMMGLKTLNTDSYGRHLALNTLRQLQELTGQLSREVHTLAWGLRPPALDDLGLHTALYNYVEEWAERSRVAVDFHSSGFEGGRLPFSHETAVYRIAQEALTNVFKHSGADRVSFILERRADHVLAVVEDNGGGFDAETVTESPVRGRKLGLLGMRERAALLGGTVNVESAPGAGTSVFVRIPVGAAAEIGENPRG